MSILQEYSQIKEKLGDERFSHIEKFLEIYPQYYLSDVYYRESVWKEFEEWEQNQQF